MNAIFKPEIAELLSTPFYMRFAGTVAVMDLTATDDSVKCDVYLQTEVPFTVEANFDGNHADPYVTCPTAYLQVFIGDKVNRMPIQLDDEYSRGICLAIESELAKEHKTRTCTFEDVFGTGVAQK